MFIRRASHLLRELPPAPVLSPCVASRRSSTAPVVSGGSVHGALSAKLDTAKLPRVRAKSPPAPGVAFSLADGTRVIAYRLSQCDEADVTRFYAEMDIDTLSEVHGSYCALRTGLFGTRDEAARGMVAEFNETVAPGPEGLPGTVIALRKADADRGLVALCHFRPVELPGVCRTFSLVVAQQYQGRNAAHLLKRIQYEQARADGFSEMQTVLDGSQRKGVKRAAAKYGREYFVLKLARMAAEESGHEVDTSRLESDGIFSVRLGTPLPAGTPRG